MAGKRKTVSIAMAAYNGARYIGEQIASILPQLSENDELIISLDPSTDGTEKVISAFGDSRIRLLDGPGQGVIKNFENALNHCRGGLIFLCDQDDVWAVDKVRCVEETFDQTGALLVLHDAEVVDGELHPLQPSFFLLKGTRTGFWRNFVKNSYIGCCMAFRAELLPFILPFPQTLPMHDQWIGLRAEKKGSVALLRKPLLKYRRHGDNVSGDTHASVTQMIKWRLQLLRALNKK